LGARDLAGLNELVSILTLFGEATTLTQAQNSPSILSIYFDLINEQDNLIYTSTLCKTLLSLLIGRFGGLLKELGVDLIYIVIRYSLWHHS